MFAEYWLGRGRKPWRWHFKSRNGKLFDNSQGFPSEAHAFRSIKQCVVGMRKAWPGTPTYFTRDPSRDGKRTVVRWS